MVRVLTPVKCVCVNACACIHSDCDQMFEVSVLMMLGYTVQTNPITQPLLPSPLLSSSIQVFPLQWSALHSLIHSFIYSRLPHSTLVHSLTHPLIHPSVSMAFTRMLPFTYHWSNWLTEFAALYSFKPFSSEIAHYIVCFWTYLQAATWQRITGQTYAFYLNFLLNNLKQKYHIPIKYKGDTLSAACLCMLPICLSFGVCTR